MPRQSFVHYIAPSAISITPNCNGSASDLAVYMARDTKIKVYSEAAKIGMAATTNTYQEWTLAGRNRRLADSSCPYTIYARLPKFDKTKGYLVFVKQQQVGQVWKDKYPYIIKDGDGLEHDVYGTESNEYYYIRMGEVSLPVEGKREVNLDTGILGTDQYNEDWNLNPDNLPMRVELNCTISDEDAGPTPYVFWGETLQLVASLIKGWSDIESPSLDHWEITRDSGDATADAAWPGSARAEQFASTGVINLLHSRTNDDFNGAVNATFTVNAWGYTDTDSSGTPQLQILQSASICIMAETLETFELISSTEIVSYNPQTQEYSPEDGVALNIRATDQRSDVLDMSMAQVTTCRLAASYAIVGDNTWTALTFSDVSGIATATIPISAFALQQSVNIRLLNGDGKEVSRKTIAFVRDGEDSKEREWIFLRSATPITFGDASSEHPKPSLISGGEVNPTGAAGGEDTNKNQDGWVPEGWWDEQRGTEESVPYEYGSYRNFIHATGDGSGSGDSPDGHWGDFTDPTIWSHFGKDGNGIVSITKTYAISAQATTANDNTAPSDITTWTTGSPATTPAKPYLWAKEVTVYTDTTKNTTKYYRIGSRGDNGIDAQDVEWVYIRTKTTTAPVIADDSAYTDNNGHTYADDDHLPRVVAEAGNTDIESNNSGDAEHPFECTDNPKGTDDTWKYEWEIKRTKGNADSTTHKRSWNTYSGTMILRTDPAFNRYISTILGGATGNATTVATAQNAVLSTLNSRIYQQGGLMLASLIAMRKLKQGGDPDQLSDYDTWGGISGQYDADARGYGIAAWYGGDMIDREAVQESHASDVPAWVEPAWGTGYRYAKSLFRFDGSGYVAGTNISWNAAGDVTIKGKTVTATTAIDTPAIYLNGTNITTMLSDLLDMFEKDTTSEPGTTLIKAKYGLYSVGGLSTLGQGVSGGGGGSEMLGDLKDVSINNPSNGQMLVYDSQTSHWLNQSVKLSDLTDVNIGSQTNGQALLWNSSTSKWVAGDVSVNKINGIVQSGACFLGGTHTGWINIARFDLTVYGNSDAQAFDLYVRRYYNSPDSESFTCNISIGWNIGVIRLLNRMADHPIVDSVRIADSGNYRYIQLYVNPTYSAYENHTLFSIIGATGTWVNLDEVASGTFTEVCSCTLAAESGVAYQATENNLISHADEFNFVPSQFSGAIYINCRTTGGLDGDITDYILCNGRGGILGSIIHSGNIGSQSVNYAASAGAVAWNNVSGRPSNISAFTNDSGYITSSGSCSYATSAGSATSASYASDLKAGSSAEIWIANAKKAYFDGNGTLVLLNSNDSAGTSWNAPALCIGGEASAAHIEIDSNEIMAKSNASTTTTLYLNAEGGNVVINETSGNCGIGTNSPVCKLHVEGTIHASAGLSCLTQSSASDIRMKNVIDEDVLPTLSEVANAPAIRFTWKHAPELGNQVGSVAQYWQKVLPETVKPMPDDILSFEYGVAALLSSITNAREIEQLKKLVSELEEDFKQLKSA